MNKIFIHYNGTIAAFKAAGHESTYVNSLVFISGDESGKGAAIYTHNKYYASVAEALASLTYFSSISDGKTTATATGPNGTIIFSGDDNSTVTVQAGSTGVKIGLSDSMIATINGKAESNVVNGINGRLLTVEGDYLKAADKTELQGKIDAKVAQSDYDTKMQELSTADTNNLKAAKDYTDAEIAKLDAAAQAQQVQANKEAIATLNGSDTGKSAREIVQDEVAKQLESENISESFDTLKEMAEYLSNHPQTVTDINEAIQAADTKAGNAATAASIADGKAVAAQSTANEAKAAAQANANSISNMALTEVSGYITKISQANGKVSATAVANVPATDITVTDTNNNFVGATVEAVVAELAAMWIWEELS